METSRPSTSGCGQSTDQFRAYPAAKGISLANVRGAKLRDIKVTGYAGPLVGIHNVSGNGLKGATVIDPPKLPDPVPAPAKPYRLR